MASLKIFVILFCISFEIVISKEITYKAAVVEYGRISPYKEILFNNLREYRWLLKSAASQDVDIIVFPEATLNSAGSSDRKLVASLAFELPDPQKKLAPCDDKTMKSELSELSCAVRDSKLYAVMHINEKVPCKVGTRATKKTARCPDDGHYLFSSNIVFDRNGRLISRYRKTHLFGEPYLDKTIEGEVATFETDFGVTFGHMICFDSMFSNPVQQLLKRGVKNFAIPLMWFSELPFLTAIQFQSAWARSNNVNLLLSGASLPSQGSTGSGIFAGKHGIKAAVMTGTSEAKLLVERLYADPSKNTEETYNIESNDHNEIRLLKDYLQYYDWKFVDNSKSTAGYEDIVCSDKFCCTFYIKTKDNGLRDGVFYRYAMVAFEGVRDFSGQATGGVQNCGVIACTSEEFSSCATRFPATANPKKEITFENIKIAGSFESVNSTQFPVSLSQNLLPLKNSDTVFSKTEKNKAIRAEFELRKPQDDLISFGIFGRHYTTDGNPVSKKSPVLETSRKGRNLLFFDAEPNCNNTEDTRPTADELYFSAEEMKLFFDETFVYVWSRMRIVLVILMIYILEMM